MTKEEVELMEQYFQEEIIDEEVDEVGDSIELFKELLRAERDSRKKGKLPFKKEKKIDKETEKELIEILEEYQMKKRQLHSLQAQKHHNLYIAGDEFELDSKIKLIQNWIVYFEKALDSLTIVQRMIIKEKYLNGEKPLDTDVMEKVNICHKTFYKQKNEAMYLLAKEIFVL